MQRSVRRSIAAAEADGLEALELSEDAEGTSMLAHAASAAVLAGLERGRSISDLTGLLQRPQIGDDRDILPFSQVLLARGALAAAMGDHAAALESFLACDRPDRGWGRDCPALVPWRSGAAQALWAQGRTKEAHERAAEEVDLARRAATPLAYGNALPTLALVGADSRRRAGLEEAASVLEDAGSQFALARVLVDLGSERRRTGDRQGSRPSLLRAYELAHASGATRLASWRRRSSWPLGCAPKTSRGTADPSTASELRVAELACGGLTNREIAQQLFLAEKRSRATCEARSASSEIRSGRQLQSQL